MATNKKGKGSERIHFVQSGTVHRVSVDNIADWTKYKRDKVRLGSFNTMDMMFTPAAGIKLSHVDLANIAMEMSKFAPPRAEAAVALTASEVAERNTTFP